MDDRLARHFLDTAARVALRAAGDVEPNPLVGCVIARADRVIGIGHHARFGGLHAEREAIADCRRRGHDPRGATLYCTLEPCRHVGKQPPCTDAVRAAGIARVVYARRDPGPESGGGERVLREAGIESVLTDVSPLATHLSDPFVHRVRTDLPWVIAKWAQTIDGRIATRTGQSQWITGPLMRRRVHRLRARVDAVLVGIGTAIADDPLLTARDVRRVRRPAVRVVVDTEVRLPRGSALARTAAQTPTVLLTAGDAEPPPGVRVIRAPRGPGGIDLRAGLAALRRELGVATVLAEPGPRVLGSLIDAGLVNDCVVHVAPMILGDAGALPSVTGRDAPRLSDARRYTLVRSKPLAGDTELWLRALVTDPS